MESQSTIRRNTRRPLLHSYGVVLLNIAYTIYRKAEDCHGPIGFLAQRLASLASPIAYRIQYQWLSILSFTDNQILTIEDMVEALFPSSAYLFNKIHTLADISETLPRKLDDVVEHFSSVVNQLPAFSWAWTHFKIGLNFLLTTLIDWEFKGVKEKEIGIDMNCDKQENKMVFRERLQLSKRVEHDKNTKPIDNSPIFSDTPQVEHKQKPCSAPHSKAIDRDKLPISEDNSQAIKQVQIPKSTYLDQKRDEHAQKFNSAEKLVFNNTQHDEKVGANIKKAYGSENADIKYVKETCNEIMDELEKMGMMEGISKKSHEQSMGGRRKQTEHQGKDDKEMNDGPILELFDAGWHMQSTI